MSKDQSDTALSTIKKLRGPINIHLAANTKGSREWWEHNDGDYAASVDVKKVNLNLPPRPPSSPAVADYACIEASTSCGFPVPAIIDSKFNVNAKHGGGTALLLLTRGKSDSDSSEITLLRCGFDGNHYSIKSLAQAGEHSIYNWNEVFTNAQGFLQPKLIYGKSHATVISNMVQFGHGGCGVLFEGPKAGLFGANLKASIVPTPPISTTADPEGSCALVICSAQPNKSGAVPSQTYLVHFQRDGNVKQVPLLPEGSDSFSLKSSDGSLQLDGPSLSHYVVYHSKSATFAEAHQDKPRGKVVHLQAFSGINPTTLLEDGSKFVGRTMLIMCSHSLQDEDSTTSALYQVTLMKDQAGVTYIAGMSGVMESADVWTISMADKKALQIIGPSGPCRYALFTNIPEDVPDSNERYSQS
eukprot:XP_011665977.1 PREDICTED: uncharacterized protein LOC105439095 [Strongylocentrotus purpuratus]